MKFGKYLLKRHLDLPEYADHFMDYKALKKLIKRLSADPQPTPSIGPEATTSQPPKVVDAHKRLQENKATFFFQLERELEKVQQFYERKEKDLEARLDILIKKKEVAEQSGTELSRTSVTYISLHEGLLQFQRELGRLEQFVELNATAFSKVLKKWDKRSRSHTKELYLARAVEVQPMFHREILVALSDKSNSSILELEALASGESAVVYASSSNLGNISAGSVVNSDFVGKHTAQAVQSSEAPGNDDDMFFEFVNFAATYDPNVSDSREAMDGWISDLKSGEKSQTHITHIFLRAIGTNATAEALLALLKTNLVDLTATYEIAGKNALHLCAGSPVERDSVFKACLDAGVIDVNQVDSYARTPLHHAAIHNRRKFLDMLIKAGANVNALDYDNYTALHYSIFHDSISCVEDLLDAGAETAGVDSERYYVPLNFACQQGSYDAVNLLLNKRGNDPMVADAEGLYPIHIVARAGFATLAPLLLSVCKDIDSLDKLNGWTALMYAAADGHPSVVKALLEAGANWTVLDENGRSALFYAAMRGQPVCLKLLSENLQPGTSDISQNYAPHASSNGLTNTIDDMELEASSEEPLDLEGIPDLSLPPPILPLQRYGHNFLDSKKIILQTTGINLHFNEDRRILSAGRLILTTSGTLDDWIPRNIGLPIQDRDQVQTFQAGSLENFGISFEVLPTFGTRLLAKATAQPYIFTQAAANGGGRKCRIPLVDALLRPVGWLEFTFLIVEPYPGKPLEISKYDTYWKSTASATTTPIVPVSASNANGTNPEVGTTLSYVTASSLHGSYSKIPVVVTRDLIPVVMDIHCVINGVSIAVAGFTLQELRMLLPKPNEVRTLAEVLAHADTPVKLELFVPFPTQVEFDSNSHVPVKWPAMNTYVDEILHITFDHARQARHSPAEVKSHQVLFTSSNSEICAMLNWKQPNYPVLFCVGAIRTDGYYTSANGALLSDKDTHEAPVSVSLEEAAHFAAINNLMGIVAPGDLLQLVPAAITAVRALGLVLVANSSSSPTALPLTPSKIDGVDAIRVNDLLTFHENIAM